MENNFSQQAQLALAELIEKAKLKKGSIVVIGCSTSEILGSKIGTNSCPDAAKLVYEGLAAVAKKHEIHLAFQCCEHLNRAIVTERATVPFAEAVNVIPQPKAGGSMATQAWAHMEEPVAIEEIRADAGLDIGLTMIGMHLKKVAVPVRLDNHTIGEAHVAAARTRAKFVGGSRAVYDEELL